MSAALLVDHRHVDPSDLRGDLFPRHYTGIATFEHEPEPEPVGEGWDYRLPDEYVEVPR